MTFPRALYRDADNYDLAADEHVSAIFDDLLGLPDPPRRRVRGLHRVPGANAGERNRVLASRAKPAAPNVTSPDGGGSGSTRSPEGARPEFRAALTGPAASGSPAARGHLPLKEQHD